MSENYTWLDIRLSTSGVNQEPHEAARERLRVGQDYIEVLLNSVQIIASFIEENPEHAAYYADHIKLLTRLVEACNLSLSSDIDFLSGIKWEFDEK